MSSFSSIKLFDERIQGMPGTLNPLAVFHSCDGYSFEKILSDGQLSPSFCEHFKENLLYLFYGRPAYKANMKLNSNKPSTMPVTFILKPEVLKSAIRIFPFDSGACKLKMFAEHLHPKMTVEEFLMNTDLQACTKLIEMFFGSNENYFQGMPMPIITYDVLNFVFEAYHSLILSNAQSEFDDRRSSIEAQMRAPISLTSGLVEAVIMPSAFAASKDVEDYIRNVVKAEILTIKKNFLVKSTAYYSEIMNEAGGFMARNYGLSFK